MERGFLVLALGLALWPTGAMGADPCRAITDEGWLPKGLARGASFGGPVVHVIDGDSFCVAVGEGPDNWVEVRLADFFAHEMSRGGAKAKSTLERLASGQRATCVAESTSYDRVVARCEVGGRSLGEAMRAAGVGEGGHGSDRGLEESVHSPPAARRAGHQPSRTTPQMSCAQLRALGGVRRGEPGYRSDWDGDADGIACEPYRRR